MSRPDGCVLWVHAARAGDSGPSIAVAQELARLRAEPVHTVVTTGDHGRLPVAPDSTIRAELDPSSASAAQRFLERWSPDLGLVIGYPQHSATIHAARDREIPLFLTSPRRGGTPPRATSNWLPAFRACLAASAAEAEAYRRHAKRPNNIEVVGPLSDTGQALACDEGKINALTAALRGRPVWFASSITPAELAAVEAAQRAAFRGSHRLLLVVSARSFEAGDAMATDMAVAGWEVSRRSAARLPDEATQVYFADVPGELGLWYRAAPISFLGGTLDETARAVDPFEPAALGSAILCGKRFELAPDRYETLIKAGGAVAVNSSDDLAEALITHLSPDRAASLAQAAWTVVTESAHVVERLAELMDVALDERDSR